LKPLNELTTEDILAMRDEEYDELLSRMFPNQPRELALALLTLADEIVERNPPNGLIFSMGGEDQSVEVVVRRVNGVTVDRHLNELRGTISNLVTACEKLIDYRRRVGPLNFQLEKADDYIRMIEREVAAAKEPS
jgi:hypothetical protein